VSNKIEKPQAQTIRQSQYRQPKKNEPSERELRLSAKNDKKAQIDSMFRKLELKKFGDDQLAELSHARFQEAKKRLRNFVINTDMKDPAEKKRLVAYFQHR
jgi:hypothetical protein